MSRPPVELRILGPTELHGPAGTDLDALLRQPKRLSVFAWLAIATADGFKRRDPLVALFWPELDQASGRTYLRKALHAIRESLGVEAFLVRGEDEIRVDRAVIWCDAVALQEDVAAGSWSTALALYRGELLEGLFPEGVSQDFEEWLSAHRRRLRESAAQAAWACSAAEEARGERTAAAVMARRARELDPDNEEGVRRLLELLDRRGDRGTALRVFAEWEARLREEFGVEPAPETRRVVKRVQSARRGESHETPPLSQPALQPHSGEGTQGDPPARAMSHAAATPGSVERRRGRWVARTAAVGVVIVVAVVALIASWVHAPADADSTIDLFPLRGIGAGDAQLMADAVSESIAHALASDTTLRLRLRDSDETGAAPQLAAEHHVEGALLRGALSVRLTLRLVRVVDGVTLWSGSYDSPVDREPVDLATLLVESAATDLRYAIKGQRP